MYDFHQDKARYFQFQYLTSRDYIMPFLEKTHDFQTQKKEILEIGCAEAGVLKAFTEKGHNCTGIELNKDRITLAKQFMADELAKNQVHFITKNIYDIDVQKDLGTRFDVVILKDVIEHIPNQSKFLQHLKGFLKPKANVFFAFPPWQMPFGGHQQICQNKLLGKLPYFHLLPALLYKKILTSFHEPHYTVQELLEIKQTGLSIEHFERILRQNNYQTVRQKHFLFNPIYEYKFGIKPKKQATFISNIPFVRNFITTAVYYLCELASDKKTLQTAAKKK